VDPKNPEEPGIESGPEFLRRAPLQEMKQDLPRPSMRFIDKLLVEENDPLLRGKKTWLPVLAKWVILLEQAS
jgi:hypothetical protein